MTIRFYRRDTADLPGPARFPKGVVLRIWRPATDGVARGGWRSPRNVLWYGFTRLGLFASRDFAELTLWQGGAPVGRLILTPRWHRFPFMAADDLQIGDVWTSPAARGRGLARMLILEARRLAATGQARRLWYVVDEANAASVALIERSGFRCVGTGRRTAPLGLRLLGQYVPG